MWRALLVLFSAAALLLPDVARADGSFLVVLEFSGQRATQIRGQVVTALGDRVELVSLSEFMATAQEEGVDDLNGRALARVCAPLSLAAVLDGEVSGGSLTLKLRSCSDGRTVEEAQVAIRRRRADPGRLGNALDRIVSRLGRLSAAQPQESSVEPEGGASNTDDDAGEHDGDAAEDDDDDEDEGEDDDDDDADEEEEEEDGDDASGSESGPTRTTRATFLSLTAGMEMGGRSFHYTDPITDNLRPYQLFGAPSVALAAELYPLSRSTMPVLRDLGITGSYALAFALSSKLEGTETVDTSWSRLQAGVRLRVRTGGPGFGLSLGFGFVKFGFSGAESAPIDELPDVDYSFLRAGLDARMPIARAIVVIASAGYMGVLSSGALDDRFPRSSAGGADLALGASWRALGPVAISLTASYTRFFFTMNPEPGDPYVAGGALDEFLGIQLGASYVN